MNRHSPHPHLFVQITDPVSTPQQQLEHVAMLMDLNCQPEDMLQVRPRAMTFIEKRAYPRPPRLSLDLAGHLLCAAHALRERHG
jgi:hypothetical protein